MTVLQIKSEGRCHICTSPERLAIDGLLEKRQLRERDAEGNRITLVTIEKVGRALGIWTVQKDATIWDSLKVHWRKHCEFVTADELVAKVEATEAEKTELEEQIKELLARDPATVSVEGVMRRIIQVGGAELEARIARGEKTGVTYDHIMKAAQELGRRNQQEAQNELLRTLTGGLGMALGAPRPQGELEAGEAEEAEYELPTPEPEEVFGDEG